MCGNLTLLGRLLPGETRAVPPRVGTLLQSMLHVTQIRGGQSGGGAVKTGPGEPRQRIAKCVNGKRSDLASRLARQLRDAGAVSAAGNSFLVQTHVRFATSGVATREESHPFRFVEAKQRGSRRVFRPGVLETAPTLRPIETAITHNGDLDALHFRGVRIAHPELGYFLERVLEAENRWQGDSPSLAGAVELFLTQGLWFESLRLAHLELIAPPPPAISELAAEVPAAGRIAFVRERLRQYPSASVLELQRLAELAEAVWLATPEAQKGRLTERDALADRLRAELGAGPLGDLDPGLLASFARRALELFLDNDLFRAVRQVEAAVEGTFGCVISSTLEPDTVVAFARGQPLSLGVQTETGCVAIVSERNALRVRDGRGAAVFDARLDFDMSNAEIARIVTGELLQPQLVLYCVNERRSYTREDLERSGRLVALRDNPLTPPLPVPAKGRLQQDLQDLPRVLREVRTQYNDPDSRNRRSAETLAYALLSHRAPRLLLLGITSDLWLAQQFANNLELCLRGVQVEAVSSNDFLKEGRATSLPPGTVVLAVSQSGQDFPTLATLLQLRQELGEHGHGRLYVLSGETDTLLGQAVGQSFSRRALWLGRILTNCGGYRPSEAATVSVNATHAALCELLLVICETAQQLPAPHHGLSLDAHDRAALYTRRNALIDDHVVPILSAPASTQQADAIAAQIGRQSRRWGRHVLEGVLGFALAGLVLEANLVLGLAIKPSWFTDLAARHATGTVARVVATLGAQADVLYYLFLTPLFIWLLRLVQGRALLHRQGVRELLIGDTAYVRQIVWLLARKLFSLSYGFASIKAYAADNQDDLVMTHEPLRGTIALLGIPDGRRPHLQGHAGAAAMSAKQFASSRSLARAGAEVVTVGHGLTGRIGVAHLDLPSDEVVDSNRTLDLLIEGMFDSWERMLAMQSLLCQMAQAVAGVGPLAYDPSRTKDQVFAPTTASPVSAAAFLGLGNVVRESLRFSRVSLPFEILLRQSRGSVVPAEPIRAARESGVALRPDTPGEDSQLG
jgi:hypothetical protein